MPFNILDSYIAWIHNPCASVLENFTMRLDEAAHCSWVQGSLMRALTGRRGERAALELGLLGGTLECKGG